MATMSTPLLQQTSVTSKIMVESEGTYSQIDFHIVLQRRSYFYVVNLILPTVLLSFLSVVTFVLPFESGEKVSYALTVLLAYSVFMLLVSDNIPSTSLHVSVLGIYLALTLFVGSSTTVMSVINLYLFHHDPLIPIIGKKRSFINNFLVPITSWENPGSRSKQPSHRNKIEPLDKTSRSKSQNKNDEPDPESVILEAVYTWKEVAAMADVACFRIYSMFVTLITVVFIIALPVGGYLDQ